MSLERSTIGYLLLALAAIVVLALAYRQGGLRFRPNRYHVAAAALWWLAAAIGTFAAGAPAGGFLVWGSMPLLAWAVAEVAARPPTADLFIPAFSILLAGVSAAALIAWLTGAKDLEPYTVDSTGRLTWPFVHPNVLGWFCAGCLPFPIVGLLGTRGWQVRVAYGVAAAVGLIALAMSLSRTSWVALVVAMAVVAAAGIGRRLILVGGAVLVVISLPVTLPRFASPDLGGDNARVDVWTNAWDRFTGSPLTGIGIGQFPDGAVVIPTGLTFGPAPHAHQIVLQVATEAGVVGLLAILAVIGVVIGDSWLAIRRSRGSALLLSAATAAGITAILVVGLLDDPFWAPPTQILTWGLFGIIAGLALRDASSADDSAKAPG